MGLLPVILGIICYSFCARKKKEHVWICSKEELDIQKDEQLESDTEYISSHDLIILAICRVVQSSDEIVVYMNNRLGDRNSYFSIKDGGNCIKNVQYAMWSWFKPHDIFAQRQLTKVTIMVQMK